MASSRPAKRTPATAGEAAPEDAQVAEHVRKVALEVLPRAAIISDLVMQDILGTVPQVAPQHTPEQIEVLRVAVEQNVGGILAMMAFGIEADLIEPLVGVVTLLRQATEDGGDVTTVLRAYRVGHARLWQEWAAEVDARIVDPKLKHAILTVSTANIFAFIDSSCERLVEESRVLFGEQGTGTWRPSSRDTIDRLRGDEPVDLVAMTRSLGYEIRDHHIGLMAVPVREDADARAAVRQVAEAATGCSLLAQATGDGSWWAWLGWPSAPSAATLEALSRLQILDVLVGLGEPGHGREGFRRSHAEAVEAERTARMARASVGGVVRHRDIEIAAVLCADPERARRFAASRLGALGEKSEAAGRVRATVRVYLACGRHLARTAEALHVHPKTVTYRLARASTLLGRSVADEPYDLEAALIIDLALNGEEIQ